MIQDSTTVEACGREWRVPSEPTVDVILQFRDWVAGQIGDVYGPVEDAIRFGLPEAEKVAIFRECRAVKEDLACFGPDGALWDRFIHSAAGGLKFTELLLKSAYPDISGREAAIVIAAYGETLQDRAKKNGQIPTAAPA